jgi:hypothetical protein
MEAAPGWTLYRNAMRDLDVIVAQESKILTSVSFSPV